MKQEKTEGAKVRGVKLRLWPLLATVLAGVLVAAALAAPKVVLALHDTRTLDTFYPVENAGGSLANPELARAVSVVDALSRTSYNEFEELDQGLDEEQYQLEALWDGLRQLMDAGVLPPASLDVYSQAFLSGGVLVYVGGSRVNGYQFDFVEIYSDGWAEEYGMYAGMNAVLYEGKILRASMQVDLPGEVTEESMVETERPVEEMMQAYIRWLGLEELDDWRLRGGGLEYSATSNYSQLALNVMYDGAGSFELYAGT